MLRLLAALAGIAFACTCAHAGERRYAVLSLLSDQMTIVTHDMATGSSLDRNRREAFAVPGNVLDKRAVLAIDDALRRAQVKPDAVLLFTSDPAIFAAQARLLEDEAGAGSLLASLRPVLQGAHATHLILASKYRHDAMLQFDLATGQVLRDVPVFASVALSAARSASGDAWDVMTPQQKANAIEALIRQETARAIPDLIAP